MYQKMKNYMEALVGKLMVNEVSEKLWIYSMIDFITKLLLVAKKDAILVVYDRLSKIVQDNIFYSNDRRNISRRVGVVI